MEPPWCVGWWFGGTARSAGADNRAGHIDSVEMGCSAVIVGNAWYHRTMTLAGNAIQIDRESGCGAIENESMQAGGQRASVAVPHRISGAVSENQAAQSESARAGRKAKRNNGSRDNRVSDWRTGDPTRAGLPARGWAHEDRRGDGYVRDVVEGVTPSILLGRRDGLTRVDEFEARHVSETAAQLRSRSTAVAERLDAGTLAIAGVTYQLADGRVTLRDYLGDIGEGPRSSPDSAKSGSATVRNAAGPTS